MKNILLTFFLLNILNSVYTQNTLNISANTHLVQGENNVLVLKNTDLQHHGTLTGGTVKITGDVATILTGNSVFAFNNLTIAKSDVDITLNQDIEVSNSLDLQSGNLQLGSNDLVIQAGGSINTATDSYIKTTGTGAVYQEVSSTEVNFPVGNATYTPLAISNAGTTGYIGVRTARGVLDGGNIGSEVTSEVVDITWHLTETSNDPKDLTVTATWNASEEATDFDRNNAFIWHYTNGNWTTNTTAAASGSDPYSLSRSGITDISQLSVASATTALPLQLLQLVAFPVKEDIQVNWTTTNEIDTDHFIVEHATENSNFVPIGRVEATGNGKYETHYSFLHTQPVRGNNYYRLLPMEHDGSFASSPIVQVRLNDNVLLQAIEIFPNPTADFIYINHSYTTPLRISLFDATGKQLTTQINPTKLDLTNFAAGVYYVQIIDTEKEEQRLILITRQY